VQQPSIDAQMIAQGLEIRDERLCIVRLRGVQAVAGERGAPAASALVKPDDPIAGWIEAATVAAAPESASRPAPPNGDGTHVLPLK
jgi:hypothetical protein